jgi:hypothetical protein|tara:strand:- start:216 stop:371 length:156 start_codon:yes stop_codon:yes gene_type:complete
MIHFKYKKIGKIKKKPSHKPVLEELYCTIVIPINKISNQITKIPEDIKMII